MEALGEIEEPKCRTCSQPLQFAQMVRSATGRIVIYRCPACGTNHWRDSPGQAAPRAGRAS